ncbi:OLC1v1001827C1 [Oldenlandia corymbosa var. corymbosa]|uniref:OLC1v1001827C1 n=1 Tax=Oldenlandia corymbosa var. corymbosa TaxID=529605 RepID=A0AAV1D9M7_OLDCO|nr:OLC1v1001827C1 [Oldenlandia corymbosa var. corymbosa]
MPETEKQYQYPIKTVVVLVQENRSFDHVLGWMKKSHNPQIDGVSGNESNPLLTPSPESNRLYFGDQSGQVKEDPGHSFEDTYEQIFGVQWTESSPPSPNLPPTMEGFVQNAERKLKGMSSEVMNGYKPELLPVFKELVSEFAVCDRWFSSAPTLTQPNRLFVHSATSYGAVINDTKMMIEGYPQKTIFESLEQSGFSFGVYYQFPPSTLFFRNLRKLKYRKNFHQFDMNFKRHCEEGKLPNYVVIEQRYFGTKFLPANDDHPPHDVSEGQKFVKEVYEALRSSPQWNEILFIVVYDEHGGFYDHVPTPTIGVPNPDGIISPPPHNFGFDRLGVRVPAILISPWIDPGTVLHEAVGPSSTSQFEHSSIPATVKKIFNLEGFLTKRDAWAATFDCVLTRNSPRTDCPVTLPEPIKLVDREVGGDDEESKLSEFQAELVQLASILKGDHKREGSSHLHKLVENMVVREAAEYAGNALEEFMKSGEDEDSSSNSSEAHDESHITTNVGARIPIDPANKQRITDSIELDDYRLQKRKEFEDQIRRVRWDKSVWVKYAEWEESRKDFKRARSIWERALEVHHRDHTLWLKYAEFEMRSKSIDNARNVWNRDVTILPRVDQLWFKYINMEETLGNVTRARRVFERWMSWNPEHEAWLSFIRFEWRYAKFEMKNSEIRLARECFERAANKFVGDEEAGRLFMSFAEFEEKCRDVERARHLSLLALDHIPRERAGEEGLYDKFVAFEKRFGNSEQIEDAILRKKRFQYEEEVRMNPSNYDAWFNYIKFEENAGGKENVRNVYKRAIAQLPQLKRNAHFEIRQRNLQAARLILGEAIGRAPKVKIFEKYIEMELKLENIDRCRMLFEKYLAWSPQNCNGWIKFAEMENSLLETERTREIFELAIEQPALDLPEVLWKAYIDFEISKGEFGKTRALYERLLKRTKHFKVWLSYAKFEASAMEEGPKEEAKEQCIQRARGVFERALDYFVTEAPELREERAMLLEEWLKVERNAGAVGKVDLVSAKLPKKVKKRRRIEVEDDDGLGRYEEYMDYLFPEEALNKSLKMLEAAYHWKKQKLFQ